MNEQNYSTFFILNTTIFIICIIVQFIFAWLALYDAIWIIIGIIGIVFGIFSYLISDNQKIAMIGFGFIMFLCYIYLLWLYLAYYNLFALYGINMPIAYSGIAGLTCSILIIILFIKDFDLSDFSNVPINFHLSILNAIIFIICIMVQLIFAWLAINDANWIIIGLLGIIFGFISLFISYNKTRAGIGCGFIMLLCYIYLLWLYLFYYGLFALYGLNMPIAYSGISGFFCSIMIIIIFFLDQENRGYPEHPLITFDDIKNSIDDNKNSIKVSKPPNWVIYLTAIIDFIAAIIGLVGAIISLI